MNLMFWKKNAAGLNSGDDSREESGEKTGERKSPGHQSREPQATGDTDAAEALDASPARPGRRLIIGAAIGVSILAAIGMAAWKILLPSPRHDTAKTEASASIQPSPYPEKQLKVLSPMEFLQLRKAQSKDHQDDIEALRKKNSESPRKEALKFEPAQIENSEGTSRQREMEFLRKRNDVLQAQIGELKNERSRAENLQNASHLAEIEILRKKNEELQTQIGVLRKKQQQSSSASPANQAAGKAQPPTSGGDMAIGNSNPKAAAMTLKEAIEVMNANSAAAPEKGRK